jgi:hypothetical protein
MLERATSFRLISYWKRLILLGVNKMSGFVAHKLSGFRVPKEVLIEADRMVTGDSENEIRRSVWWVAAGAFDARGSGEAVGCL